MAGNPVLSLIGDIGGTNARFALVEEGSIKPLKVRTLACADFTNVDDAIDFYIKKEEVAVSSACLAFACPVHDDRVCMTNNHWNFSKKQVADKLGLDSFSVINDFHAQAMSLPWLSGEDLLTVGGGREAVEGLKLIIGPGTGLGVAGLIRMGSQWKPISGEGGHVDFAPRNELEIKILEYLLRTQSRVTLEHLLSGAGLERLFKAHAMLSGNHMQLSAPQITSGALENRDVLCTKVLNHFCEILGSAAGNAALTLGARGGVYIAGGIVPRFKTFFKESAFRQVFEGKSPMTDYNAGIGTHLVCHEYPGLIGAAAELRQQ